MGGEEGGVEGWNDCYGICEEQVFVRFPLEYGDGYICLRYLNELSNMDFYKLFCAIAKASLNQQMHLNLKVCPTPGLSCPWTPVGLI